MWFNKKSINVKKRCVDWSNNNNIIIINILLENNLQDCTASNYSVTLISTTKIISDLKKGGNHTKMLYNRIKYLILNVI
jgi:hypothetical protein